MIKFSYAILAFISYGSLGGLAIAETGKTIKDWVSECDETSTCTMRTQELDGPVGALTLRRDAGFSSDVLINFGFEDELADGSKVVFSFSEAELPVIEVFDDSTRYYDEKRWFHSPHIKTQLIPAMIKSSKIYVSYETQEGEEAKSYSLAGAAANFLFLDEYQGRVGLRDSLFAANITEGEVTQSFSRELKTASQ